MFIYLVIALVILAVAALLYATRRQAAITARQDMVEPDIDLGVEIKTTIAPEPKSKVEVKRDPALARMTSEDLVLEVLRECQDPEIPLNIVELGLVYKVQVTKDAVQIKMSMTTPDCPSHHSITQDVRAKLEDAGFPDPQIELVWDPPWSAHRISEEGKKKLGM